VTSGHDGAVMMRGHGRVRLSSGFHP
jgi:hypothetical protein